VSRCFRQRKNSCDAAEKIPLKEKKNAFSFLYNNTKNKNGEEETTLRRAEEEEEEGERRARRGNGAAEAWSDEDMDGIGGAS